MASSFLMDQSPDAPRCIVTIGEIVVEIMAETQGTGFLEPIALKGPYPSGAPAIFIDQVARLGVECGIVSAVGRDDFGALNIERLKRDGVDISAILSVDSYATGSAFVRYRPDGSRDFVYNIRQSACSQTGLHEAARGLLKRATHVHVMGSSLFSFPIIDAVTTAVHQVKAQGGTVSFDPNIRKEMLDIPDMRAALQLMLQECDIFLPSGPELLLFSSGVTHEEAIAEILDMGVSEIVLKQGSEGATCFSADKTLHSAPFAVEEIDPTGAGDCFGATYVTCRLLGKEREESLRYACASGARAVSFFGPMEGTSDFASLDRFIASQTTGEKA
ncbi:sugar kinase [Asaia lannensis]|uniref:Sugar kinase n=1 Tax=Asaia lannensis NBRC 102526 TaxID=1307926 RepID=A0ABT1CJZ3_9PROT|nr:sugar kinase [Asaia lannensis]MCO6160876.1 sugar kinase [Asaia lannensis NBRC 102526]GBR01494.1 ribokinase-like domain-containing protein [Asaia lannensis NBRC 102526]